MVTATCSPSVLFLDEPTSGLDSFTAHQVMKAVKRLVRSPCRQSTNLTLSPTSNAEYHGGIAVARAMNVA